MAYCRLCVRFSVFNVSSERSIRKSYYIYSKVRPLAGTYNLIYNLKTVFYVFSNTQKLSYDLCFKGTLYLHL